MSVSVWKRAGVSLTAVAVVAGVAGCQGEKKSADAPRDELQWSSAAQVIQAAYEKTAAAKSAKIRMTVSMPEGMGGMGGMGGGAEMEMSGVMGWDPGMMDITMKGGPGGAGSFRMVMLDEVMYMDMSQLGEKMPAELRDKSWLRMDFKAIAEKSGNAELQKQMTGSLENMNQDPAKQLAMLLDSPNLKHIGPEKVDGVDTQHYKGSLTVEEMLAANKSLSVLDEDERKELVAKMKESGLKAYDTEVWVNEDGYPVKMDIGMETPEGTVTVSAAYSDYGTKAAVQAPPADQTIDFMKMIEKFAGAAKDAEGAAA
ncbi:hypothetical protein [Streptomyces sp. TRM49041]|uniref:hypothetical protein n=1 Tax=Streptomyces sp. TRM49041 TaxID=2603216 RepID=UPI0011EDFFA4|nr:hypothetical protein [Streptomyces sp. TRM49041]